MRMSAEQMIKGIPDYDPEAVRALRKWLGENPHYPPTSGERPPRASYSCPVPVKLRNEEAVVFPEPDEFSMHFPYPVEMAS